MTSITPPTKPPTKRDALRVAVRKLRFQRVIAARPVFLLAILALLLSVPFLFHAGSTVHAADNDVGGVTLTSANPGELVITWDAPSRAPDDYRVTWKKSDGKWPSFKNDNTVDGGNAFPTATSHTVTGLEEGTAYKARVRARYFDDNGNLEQSGPWSATEETAVAQTPPPGKPTGLITAASHDTVLLSWTDPGDDTITGYQVLRGPDADNLAVLADNTGSTSVSYTDETASAETSYAYAVKARNAGGLSPRSEAVTVTTLAPPAEDEPPVAEQTGTVVDICSRTPEVQTGILDYLENLDSIHGVGRKTCSTVTDTDLNRVRSLYVRHYSAESIVPQDFAGLPRVGNLIFIDSNRLRTVPEDAFSEVPTLVSLTLRDNGISSIHRDAFDSLTELGIIHIDNKPPYDAACGCLRRPH